MRDLEKVPTDELVERAAQAAVRDPTREADDRWALVRELHHRGGESVFRAAGTWCTSPDSLLKCLGADVLGQLGFELSYPFASASEPILTSLLGDPDASVVSCALVGLGHLSVGDPLAISALTSHESADVRHSVTFCLGRRDDDLSRGTLILLSSDRDPDVRNWATFGLGTLSELDSPDIRKALVARLSDADHEVRGEATLGLAARGDIRAVPAILKELKQDDVSVLAIEAAAKLQDKSFLAGLEALLEAHPSDPDIKLAVERCRAK